MTRWAPDARERLERASVELFEQQGFAATTVPEITARAGLTTRTFFRHFADKREVLFAGEEIPQFAASLIAATPPSASTSKLILSGLRVVAETRFEGRRPEVRRRREIIRSDESLRERDLHKRAALRQTIQTGLADRGVAPRTASLLAETTVTVLYVALDEWLDQHDDDQRSLTDIIADTIASLRAAVADLA